MHISPVRPPARHHALPLLCALALVACSNESGPTVPTSYEFESRLEPGVDSVVHTGQTARHLLIEDLKGYVGDLTAEIDGGTFEPAADGDVVARLEYFFSVDGADRASDPIRLTDETPFAQSTWGEISDADLFAKLAGNDAVTDHRDWSTEFSGFSDTTIAAYGGGVDSPTRFVRAMFETLEENAIARATGTDRLSPTGQALPVHVTESGLDLQELLAKFLLGAVTFSQAADDYLDDDVAGKGLLSDNIEADGGPYTSLEHAWDEAFGYFGASVFYGDRDVSAIASTRAVDRDGDGQIDLLREYDFGASVNAAKRDAGSAESARTSFAETAWLAFRTGRAIITDAGGALDDTQMEALREQRDLAIGAWEAAIAATVVHYINELLQIMDTFDATYDHATFLEHAGAWSEMKGFALMFQFNPRSPLSRAQFGELHSLLGDAPVLPAAGASAADAYRADLLAARGILGAAFDFDAANLGDSAGSGGW